MALKGTGVISIGEDIMSLTTCCGCSTVRTIESLHRLQKKKTFWLVSCRMQKGCLIWNEFSYLMETHGIEIH